MHFCLVFQRLTKYSRWLGDNLCRASIICPALSPNVCSEYGIEVSFGGEETETLCHQGVLHKGEMAPGQEMSTSIWYTRWSSDLDLDCYFWCTEDGEVPQRPTDREEASDEIDKKVCFA